MFSRIRLGTLQACLGVSAKLAGRHHLVICLPDTSARISRHRRHLSARPHDATDREDALSGYLSAAGRGDHKEFELVYSLTHRRLFRICLNICRDHQAAEDALAETYLSVFRRCGWWDPARGSAIAWMSTIARNRAIDRLRHSTSAHLSELSDAKHIVDLEPNGEERLIEYEQTVMLQRCINRLSERDQDALRLAFFEGCTYSELARRVGVPHATMKSTIRRALARLSLDPELSHYRTC